jgi:hypothetical protein
MLTLRNIQPRKSILKNRLPKSVINPVIDTSHSTSLEEGEHVEESTNKSKDDDDFELDTVGNRTVNTSISESLHLLMIRNKAKVCILLYIY